MILLPQKVAYRGSVSDLRISSVDGTAFIDNLSGTLELQNAPLLHTGSLTQANTRISAAATVAFIDTDDATFATNLAAHLGKYLVIKDSAGKKAYAWIKAAGSAEGLDDELVTNGDFGSDVGWDVPAGWAIGGGVATGTTVTDNLFRSDLPNSIYKLHKVVLDLVSRTAGNVGILLDNMDIIEAKTVPATYTAYRTRTTTSKYVYVKSGAFSGTVDNVSIKPVTAPSANGATLSSTKGGTAMDNWESIESGFNYNDSSGYTYYIYGRDIVDLADGNHLIEIYDATGKVLKGFLKAQGAGETVGSELVAAENDRTFASDTGWWNKGIGVEIADGVCKFTDVISNRGLFRAENILVTNVLYKGAFDIANYVSGGVSFYLYTTPAQYSTLRAANGAYTAEYFLAPPEAVYRYPYIIQRVSATTLHLDNVSISPVLTPSTDGCTIVSTKGGATQSFAIVQAGFAYNAAAYSVVVRKAR